MKRRTTQVVVKLDLNVFLSKGFLLPIIIYQTKADTPTRTIGLREINRSLTKNGLTFGLLDDGRKQSTENTSEVLDETLELTVNKLLT